jgi:hypothetical protein
VNDLAGTRQSSTVLGRAAWRDQGPGAPDPLFRRPGRAIGGAVSACLWR